MLARIETLLFCFWSATCRPTWPDHRYTVHILQFCNLLSTVLQLYSAVLRFAFCKFCSFKFFGRKRKVSYKVLLFSMCTEKKNWSNMNVPLISGLRYKQRTKARYSYSKLFCFAFDFSDFESKARSNYWCVTTSHICLYTENKPWNVSRSTFKFWAGLQKVLSARHT